MAEAKIAPLFTWRSAIAAPDSGLKPTQRHVALTLALHMNERGGSAFPGAKRLADETGLAVGTVRRVLTELVAEGWLELRERGGRRGESRRANVYVASIPHPRLPVTDDDGSSSERGQATQDDPSHTMTRNPVMHDPSSSDAPPLTQDDPSTSWSTSWSTSSSADGASEGGLMAAISIACGQDRVPPPGTRAFQQLEVATADIAKHGAQPHEVPARAREYHRRFPDATMTPMALARYWPQLVPEKPKLPVVETAEEAEARFAALTGGVSR